MDKQKLKQVILDQQAVFKAKKDLIDREIKLDYYLKGKEIVVISGVRRCGKSSLLKLIADQDKGQHLYLNFDDIRLVEFSNSNFTHIEEIALELFDTDKVSFFLDEIQNVPNWERWINTLHAQDKKVFVTGSNSRLLSSEISTYLTGRNKQIHLFPFSFREFLTFSKIKPKHKNLTTKEKIKYLKLFQRYLTMGGFPLILKNNDIDLSRQYFEDIVHRDIISRFGIREVKELKDMVLFLFSNIGKTYSYATLRKITSIKSLSTIKNYLDHLHSSFLLHPVGKFDYSIKKQKVASAKIYANDTSFLKTVAFNFSENYGRRLENLVLLELKRRQQNVYYHAGKLECDFVIQDKNKVTAAMQVTRNLGNPKDETYHREINGLLEALETYKLTSGLILTESEEDVLKIKGKKIIIKPVWSWLLEKL